MDKQYKYLVYHSYLGLVWFDAVCDTREEARTVLQRLKGNAQKITPERKTQFYMVEPVEYIPTTTEVKE